jgi:CheY-like chemotaxis protein
MGRQRQTPTFVLGGDPDLNALLFEAIDRVASPVARKTIITRALRQAGSDKLPADIQLLMQFVTGPLFSVARGTLGDEAAGALVSDVQPLLERVQRIRSSIPPPSKTPAESLPPSEHFSTLARTLPPSGLFRETKRKAPPSSEVQRRGTLPYAEAVTSTHYVLLVDDDVVFLRGLSRLMRATGLEVLTAPEGGTALRICEKMRPVLVITDLDMPPPNGLQLAASIAERLGNDAPPVFLLTGSPEPPPPSSGVTKVLTKMIRPDDLLAEIQPYLPVVD